MALLDPQSIAVIGASATPGKVGHDILKNLLTQGYDGKVFPVNPKGGEILGATVYPSMTDIPEIPELAVIVIPATAVPQALTECGEKGIKNVVVISAGFGEVHTDEGKNLEEDLVAITKKHSINLLGPNCLGVVRPHAKMNASFAKELPPAGNIAFVSQSGAVGVALMDGATSFGLGLSAFLSIGNKAAFDESNALELLMQDAHTHVIGFYLESIKDGRRFMDIARASKKPIVLLKAGVSEHGRKAASSHTGALAGSDAAIDALCAQTGIHRARSTEEFLDLLSVLSMEPPLLSNRIGIITNAGGPGILATDAAAGGANGAVETACMPSLQLPRLSENTETTLRAALPAAASTQNPIDVIGDAGADRYEAAIDACQNDPNIDGLVIILTPQVMTPVNEIAELIVRKKKESPLMPIVTAFMGSDSVHDAKKILRAAGVPCFETPERAINALRALATGHQPLAARGQGLVARGPSTLLIGRSGLLDESITAKLFNAYNLPLPKQDLATTAEEAVHIAEQIGYPVIAKISSPDILHKTDVGGVRANLQNPQEMIAAFNGIMTDVRKHHPDAPINGMLIQQFLPVGNEFIVGAVRDPSFGPLIMAGLGGIYTELFKDSAFRIAPVDSADAYAMLSELESWKLLLGMRGKPQADIDALAQVIVNVSRMMIENPSITELDLNPVLVRTDGVMVADAKVVIG